MKKYFFTYGTVLWGLLTICFVLFYMGTSLFPLCSDDFSYSFVCGESGRVQSVSDILRSQIYHYQKWGGRFWNHCLVQFFLMFDKAVFNIANVCVYAACTYFISHLSQDKIDIKRWAFVAMTYWLIMPHPGSSMLWLTGSINYLWASCVNAAFLFVLTKVNKKWFVVAVPLALVAGNSHEGISIGVSVALVIYVISSERKNKSYYFLILLFIMGMLSNVLAPGNVVRAGSSMDASLIEMMLKIAKSLVKLLVSVFVFNDIGLSLSFILSVLLSVFVFVKMRSGQNIEMYSCLLVGAFVGVGLNLVTGVHYPRALYGFCFLFYLSGVLCITQNSLVVGKFKSILCFLFAVSLNIVEIPKALFSIRSLDEMIRTVRKETESGKTCIAMKKNFVSADSRYMERCGLSNNYRANQAFTKYFGGCPFSLLSSDMANCVFEYLPQIETLREKQVLLLTDGLCIVRLPCNTSKESVLFPKVFVNYGEGVMSLLSKYMPPKKLKITPAVLCINGCNYALWKNGGCESVLSFKGGDGRSDEVNIVLNNNVIGY